MQLKDFDYHLPKNLIAQEPIKPRDHSRLLLLQRKNGNIRHKHFYDLADYLKKGDVLVLNNSKVFKARLMGKRKTSGGKIEVFLLPSSQPPPLLLSRERGAFWQCLVGGARKWEGLEIKFGQGLECKLIKNNQDGTWEVKFNQGEAKMMKTVEKIGQVPLPPYIKRGRRCQTPYGVSDTLAYQTVYADSKKVGSVAAPTAGFHFTPRLIKKLKARGVRFEYITLHVGLGTFAPVKVNDIKKHKMHAEFVEIKKEVMKRIIKAKKENRRIIAVGTTSVRTLEAVWKQESGSRNQGFGGWVDIFIYPGYKFKVIDALITNFHLPKSTLLMLVMAFVGAGKSEKAGREIIFKAYQSAIRRQYRFYSYGDAMFIY